MGAIVDSSKISQLMTAHQRKVEFDTLDHRPDAIWAKCHALVGVETLVVMAVEFSLAIGRGTHDVNFVTALVATAIESFPLEFLLGDKAYLCELVLEWLKKKGLRAAISLKKGWFKQHDRVYREHVTELVEWFEQNENRDFHEVYRLRPKCEALFTVLKRKAQGYCWSRGRPRRDTSGLSTAWTNELLCKFIYVNLLATVDLEKQTGIQIDYLIPSRHFPPPDDPLLKSRKAA